MKVDIILEDLKKLGDPRALTVWEKLGMNTNNYYGVGLTKLKNYAKNHKRDRELAEALWAKGIRDAQTLATLIDEPKKLSKETLTERAEVIDFWDLGDYYVQHVVVKSPYVYELITEWAKSKSEFVKRAAYMALYHLTKKGNAKMNDEFFEIYIERIENEIHEAPNWAKEGMMNALIGMGKQSKALNKKAVSAAKKISDVEIDYGDSSCMQPNPLKSLTGEKTQTLLAEKDK